MPLLQSLEQDIRSFHCALQEKDPDSELCYRLKVLIEQGLEKNNHSMITFLLGSLRLTKEGQKIDKFYREWMRIRNENNPHFSMYDPNTRRVDGAVWIIRAPILNEQQGVVETAQEERPFRPLYADYLKK